MSETQGWPPRFTGTAFKSDLTPVKVERRKSKRAWQSVDEAENETVKVRSEGRCEAVKEGRRCDRSAVLVHHRLAGNGVRGRGESAKAENKLHVCLRCHLAIHDRERWTLGYLQPVTTRIEWEPPCQREEGTG